MRSVAIAFSMALVAALPGCVSADYRREVALERLPRANLERLRSGESDLRDCLEGLGAPLYVWEHGEGLALAWGWLAKRGWGVTVNLPLDRRRSLSLDYDRADSRTRGYVLFFDRDWKLVTWRSGLLRNLAAEARRVRPSAADEG